MRKSRALYREARTLMPGGVSSPARAFPPHPLYLARGSGSRVADADGRTYIDLNMAFGALLLGHRPPEVVRAVRAQLGRGTHFGAPHALEVEVARELRERMPALERLRFVNSGTEATMAAVRLARGATRRPGVVKMDGGFHGSHDAVLVKAGSGAQTHGVPTSAGVPAEAARHTHVLPYNDARALERLLKRRRDVAAVLMEPVLANVGTILPAPGYLAAVREATEERDVLLIFDEVITGLRLPGGAQGLFGVKPDLTTLGKALGSGLPIGVYGGRRDLMSLVAPEGPVYQAGTYSGNPLSLAAARAVLSALTPALYDRLESRGRELFAGLAAAGADHLHFCGSLGQLFFGRRPIRNARDARRADGRKYMRFFRAMLRRGVYLAPSPFETQFLSGAHSSRDVERVVAAARRALRSR
jgi:glutamate-1-semialdehyde 2,1-aminomutase